MSYRPPSDGYLTCHNCGADLAEGAAFCAACGASQDVARPTGRPAGRGSPAWLPFAIVGGGIAALGAGVLLAVLLSGTPDGVAGDPSPSASVSLSASASASASDSAEASPTAEPTPEPAALIPNLGIAAVVTDVVNLRSQPNDAADLITALATDRRLFVIGAPTEADDLRWYRVATVADPSCTEQCEFIGYVATPVAADEDPWISAVAVDCPVSPMTVDDLAALAPLEALHCFGRNEIVVTGTIADSVGGYEAPIDYDPAWLAHPFAPPWFATSAGRTIGYHPHPDADLEPPGPGDVIRLTGHHEDPAAASCRAFITPGREGEADEDLLPDPVLLVLTCRATLAWTDYEVVGP